MTMFTSALLETLQRGVPNAGQNLSFRDVTVDIRRSLLERFGAYAVLPVIHDPVQPEGHVTETPLFHNRLKPRPQDPSKDMLEDFQLADGELRGSMAKDRLAALEIMAELLEKTKSTDFHNQILMSLRRCKAEDDSRAVINRCVQILETYLIDEITVDTPDGPPLKRTPLTLLKALLGLATIAFTIAFVIAIYLKHSQSAAIEASKYAAAGDSIVNLSNYVRECQICEFKDRAEAGISEIANRQIVAASFDSRELHGIAAECDQRCPNDVIEGVAAKLRTIEKENGAYRIAGNDAEKLARYIGECLACEFKDPSNNRVAGLLAGKFDDNNKTRMRLTSIQTACNSRCSEGVDQQIQARLDTLNAEVNEFNAAGDDIRRIHKYLSTCRECEFDNDAQKRMTDLTVTQLDDISYDRNKLSNALKYCGASCPVDFIAEIKSRLVKINAERDSFTNSKNDAKRLTDYVSNCQVCEFKATAEKKLVGLAAPTKFRSHDNRDLDGHDLDQSDEEDATKCETSCGRNAQCLGYTYNKWNRKCFIKDKFDHLRLEPRAASGIRDDLPPISQSKEGYIMRHYSEKAFSKSNPYNTAVTQSLERCDSTCMSDKVCVAFTYSKETRKCALFEITDEYFDSKEAVSGIKTQ
ncbi:PAN domain-containing protein [Beijerinckia sp. L45]|uniref:PAN domain-containing protein n=1 Tax=Beijerinckia sp. L45 TaxID=1641855 RepID=UPI00131D0777|nr:PAN domain-containing protein [Beijerinckia sp. L45]